ncbi:hypothetical protein D5086_006900 [Populus alba]|uniref:Uncharacterized protein n=1 Tax=Populus alba TaxID=43335 RepID=A0ACC4CM18_POPAL
MSRRRWQGLDSNRSWVSGKEFRFGGKLSKFTTFSILGQRFQNYLQWKNSPPSSTSWHCFGAVHESTKLSTWKKEASLQLSIGNDALLHLKNQEKSGAFAASASNAN